MTTKSISFRSGLVANTSDVIRAVGIDDMKVSDCVVAVISALAAYTEEGVRLTPSVYICKSIDDLVKRAGLGSFIVLGSETETDKLPSLALKFGAPLCTGMWNIFIEHAPAGACRFGVFSETADPAALTADETLLGTFEPEFPILKISQNGVNRVRLVPGGKPGVEFRFNADVDVAELTDRTHIATLASMISKDDICGEAFSSYCQRLLAVAVDSSHGTLIAVVTATAKIPKTLTDVVQIEPPLDLRSLHAAHVAEGRTAESVGRLQGATELVSGFIASDGITIFDTCGRLRAYRGFVKPTKASSAVSGGARTRAFEALKGSVGKGLVAAFFRSQDGRTEISHVPEDKADA